MPEVITTIEVTTLTVVIDSVGLTITPLQEVMVAEISTDLVHVYTTDLMYQRQMTVAGAVALRGITNKEGVLFLADKDDRLVHVMDQFGSYRHKMNVNIDAHGVSVWGSELYISDNDSIDGKLVKVTMDASHNKITEEVFKDSTDVSRPNDVYANAGLVAVTSLGSNNLKVYDPSGILQWVYGSVGTGDGQFKSPRGVTMDSRGRFIIVDVVNKRVQLIGADGTFIRYLITGMAGNPKAITVMGNTVYLTQASPKALIKLEVF
jgi:DNA-binding beta-propeller fold protein YncE